MGMFSKSIGPLVAFDVSPQHLRLLELEQSGRKRLAVKACVVLDMPPGAMQEHQMNVQIIGDLLRQALRLCQTKSRKAGIALHSNDVIERTIEMPAGLSDKDLEAQIMAEVEQYLPFPQYQAQIDFGVIGPSEEKDDTDEVWVAACRQETIDVLVDIMDAADMQPTLVDVESHCIERALPCMAPSCHQETIAMVSIDLQKLDLHVLQDGEIVMHREESFGTQRIIDDACALYGISPAEAVYGEREQTLPGDFKVEIVQPFVASYIEQIKFLMKSASGSVGAVSRVLLCGSLPQRHGIAGAVDKALAVPVELADPFKDMELGTAANRNTLGNHSSSLVALAGLALRGI